MRHLNFDRLLILSIGFLLLFTSFGVSQGLAAKVLEDNDFGELGFYSLALLYVFFGIAAFLSTPVVNKLGERMSLVVGSLCYALYVATFILAAFRNENPDSTSWILNKQLIAWLILITAAINGFGAGILWVAEGKYISDCANDSNKGYFNGFFFMFYMSYAIVGNLCSAFVI